MTRGRLVLVAFLAGAFLAGALLAASGRLAADGQGTDPARLSGDQWNLELVGAPEAWATTRGEGVRVAVVDSGIDARHPDLRDRVVASADCVGAAGDPDACGPGGDTDPDGHGTHVAGIVAAAADDGRGVAGVAPEARILSVRALVAESCPRRPCGATGDPADVAAAVRWARRSGADVINLSAGTVEGAGDPALEDAVDEATGAGVVVVVAGGNDARTVALTPPAVLVVGAVTADGDVAPYSRAVDPGRRSLAAPGGRERSARADGCDGDQAVLSTLPVPGGEGEAYGCLTGTSMAAPHVAGAAALLRAEGLTGPEAVDRLLATARPAGPPGSGPPLLDVAAAVADP